MQVPRIEVEELAQSLPLVAVRLGGCLGESGRRKQWQAGGDDTGLLEEGATVGHEEIRYGWMGEEMGLARFCTSPQTRRKLPPHSLAMSASE
ncbi:Uncharacterised protein [Acinetobacter baumannii]|nr:Uncharacterised protein [Acinetobacter baumannii]